jgi:hypothetical protein
MSIHYLESKKVDKVPDQ